MKMKQCTLFLPQEATWAISNVTAGPKEQIQVKKYQYLRMHQAKWLYLLHSYLLPTNCFSSTVGLELAKSGLCNHALSPENFENSAVVRYNKSFIVQMYVFQMLV